MPDKEDRAFLPMAKARGFHGGKSMIARARMRLNIVKDMLSGWVSLGDTITRYLAAGGNIGPLLAYARHKGIA
jgi:hypothetical protein